METTANGIVGRFTARRGNRRGVSAAERRMNRRDADRSYWAARQASPSQLVEIHAMYAQESSAGRH